VAKLPATAVTTKTAHASRPTSTILPADVSGFLICDETVSNCTAEKKAASPNPWISLPFLNREEPRQFFSYHRGVSLRPAQRCQGV
jgi:hypothetical protein